MRRVHLVLILVVSAVVFLSVLVVTVAQATLLQQISAIFLGFLGGMAAIAEIIGLFDRLGVPDTVFSSEPKFIQKEQSPFETTVAIWGPMASGKSWLIHSFAWTIRQKYKGNYLGLKYKLSKIDPDFADFDLTHAPPPTEWVSYSRFRFERVKTSNKFFESMSSFTHNIHIYDNQGGASSRIGGDNQNHDDLATIIVNLANADIVLLALDPTQVVKKAMSENISDSLSDNENSSYSFRNITSVEYAEMVKRLFAVLEKANPDKQRLYAACITKADVIPGGVYLHPDALIEAYFGQEMSEALATPKKGIVQTFTTSSFGFLPGSTNPNFDSMSRQIADKENWQPYGVEFPFFWAFETQERKLLRKTLQNSIWGKLTFYGNFKNYIPYPKPKYEI